MFVCSLKGKSIKTAGVIMLSVIVIAILICIIPDYDTSTSAYVEASTNENISFKGIKTNEDRLAFINKFGINVSAEPIEEYTTTIPNNFDSVYTSYNAIQKAQGLDLSKYKGKKITRYTYEITNYPHNAQGEPSGKVFLNIIMCKNRVIGGDIASSEMGGFVKTFTDFKGE